MANRKTSENLSISPESTFFFITIEHIPLDSTCSSILVQLLDRLGPDIKVLLARKNDELDTIFLGLTSSTNFTNTIIYEYVTSYFFVMESLAKLIIIVSRRKGLNSSCTEMMSFLDILHWGISPAELHIWGSAFKRKLCLVIVANQYLSQTKKEKIESPVVESGGIK